MTEWIKDDNGNKCSIKYWGSKEAAQTALDSLKNCKDCSDCAGCSGCSDCAGCSYCSDCAGCSDEKNLTKKEGENAPPPVPTIENIHTKVYEAASHPKALAMDTWHTCANTHCRAGWVVTLAGEAGKALETFYDTVLAAMMIYDASSTLPKVSPVKFFDSNDDALDDMKRMAELEATPR
jgi:hypothetical protein